jgi:hypothetical protein
MEQRRSVLNQEDAQGLMARHLSGQGPRTKDRREGVMDRIVTKSGQSFGAAFVVRMFRIDVIVVIVGRKYSILTRADRMMNRVVSTASAQTCQDAVATAAAPIGVAVRSLSGAGAGQEQAGENDANEHFGDRLHKEPR